MHRRIWIRHPEGNTYGDGPQGTQNSKHTTLTCTRANHAPPSSLSKVSLVSSCPRGAPGRKLLGCILDTYTDLESFSNFRAHRYFVCYEYQVLTLSSVTNARAGWSNSYLQRKSKVRTLSHTHLSYAPKRLRATRAYCWWLTPELTDSDRCAVM